MKRSLILNPNNHPATWGDIKAKRDALEQSPLAINGMLFDADEISETRMRLAVENFDSITMLVDGKLYWKLYTNEALPFSKLELTDILTQLRQKLSQRAAILHMAAPSLVAQSLTIGQLDDLQLWGVDAFLII